jgi:DegV family protein with EDD domain
MKVQIITDSTADISPELIKELDIKVVPIYIHFGNKTYRDGLDISTNQFYSMLDTAPVHPTTSQPSPGDFARTYLEYIDKVDGIASIHISSKISGTFNTAVLARDSLKNNSNIEVIDSKFNSAGLGLVVTAAARLAKAGAGLSEVILEANSAIRQINMFGMFSTMKYLARSGRVNKTIAAASQFLHIMPLLTFHEGEIVRAGLVRTVLNGMEHIHNFVKNNVPVTEIIIVHSDIKTQALQLKQKLSEFISEEKIRITDLGAGLGVHGGPGVLLVSVRRAEAL